MTVISGRVALGDRMEKDSKEAPQRAAGRRAEVVESHDFRHTAAPVIRS